MEEVPKKVRRHDIDWLRVILFGLLIPFHVGLVLGFIGEHMILFNLNMVLKGKLIVKL